MKKEAGGGYWTNNNNNSITSIEYFTPIAKFRWLARGTTNESINYKEVVLQQLHQGSNGTEKWEDIETVFEK